MKVWFVIRGAANLRFVLPVLDALEQRGHRAIVSFALPPTSADELRALEFAPGVELEPLVLSDGPSFSDFADRVVLPMREVRSYVAQSPHWPPVLRARWRPFLPRPLRPLARLTEQRTLPAAAARRVAGLLAHVEGRFTPPAGLVGQLRRLAPDVVLVSPMVYPQSREIDVVRAARVLGIPSAGLVLSWDNLTSKGSFHAVPDRLLVWNDVQRREAVSLHAIGDGVVEVVGAPVFDYLFDSTLRLDREAFLSHVGIDRGADYVLYAVSSQIGLGPGREVEIAVRVATELRAREGAAAPLVLVRPHPKNASGWNEVRDPGIKVMESRFPDSEEERIALTNAISHSSAVVGLNTSVFLEASVLDKPCVSLRFRPGDARAVTSSFRHFQYLVEADVLYSVVDEREAADALIRLKAAGEASDRRRVRREFVELFVRPMGLDRPASDVAADALIALVGASS